MWDIYESQSSVLVRLQDREGEETKTVSLTQTSQSAAPHLENIFCRALTCLQSTQRKLTKQPDVAAAYQEEINGYERKCYIQEVQEEIEVVSRVWSLPHFPVVR